MTRHLTRTVTTDQIIEAVLSSKSIKQAADLLGMSATSLYRKLREPEMRAALDEARRDLLRAALSQMHGLLAKALAAVERALDDDQPTSIQLAAARLLIENTLRASDAFDLDARISALEAQRAQEPEYERKQA